MPENNSKYDGPDKLGYTSNAPPIVHKPPTSRQITDAAAQALGSAYIWWMSTPEKTMDMEPASGLPKIGSGCAGLAESLRSHTMNSETPQTQRRFEVGQTVWGMEVPLRPVKLRILKIFRGGYEALQESSGIERFIPPEFLFATEDEAITERNRRLMAKAAELRAEAERLEGMVTK